MNSIFKEDVDADSGNTGNGVRKLGLFFVGFMAMFAGILLLITATAISSHEGSSSFGGVIIIGPIPIVIGSGPDAAWMVLLALALTILSIAAFLIMRKKMKNESV